MIPALNNQTVSTLVSPQGQGHPLVRSLYGLQQQKALINLIRLQRKLKEEAPTVAEEAGFFRAVEALSGYDSTAQRRVMGYPSAAYWLDVAWNLMHRQAHRHFPEMHFRMHLEEFWRFPLAAHFLSQDEAVLDCMLWSDAAGRLFLPGTGQYLELDDPAAYTYLRVAGAGGNYRVFRQQSGTATEVGFTRRLLPRFSRGIELNGLDGDLRLSGRTAFQYEQPAADDQLRWHSVVDEALDWINTAAPQLMEEILLGVSAIVPIVSEAPEVHNSATFREAPGLMALSWTPDTAVMAEAIVHEYHHQKLNALLNADPLISGPTGRAMFYSPWRRDARPLLGILHGSYVFQAVLEFWEKFFQADVPILYEARVEQRMHLIYDQVQTGIEVLRREAELTELGRHLLEAMQANLERCQPALPSIDAAIRRRLTEMQQQHRRQWEQDNQSGPGLAAAPAAVAARADADQALRDKLSLDRTFDVAEMGRARYADDPVMMAVVGLQAGGEQELDALAAELGPEAGGGSTLVGLVAGHIAYVRGDFVHAAERYARCAAQDPGNPYFWQCAAFALRHQGRIEESDFILHRLGAAIVGPHTAAPLDSGEPVAQLLCYLAALSGETLPGE